MPFFQNMDRYMATLWVQSNPQTPVLRPCIHTELYYNILAVTYMYQGNVCHSLVERRGTTFNNIIYQNGVFERTGDMYSSEAELEQVLREFSYPDLDEDPSIVLQKAVGEYIEVAEDPCIC